MKTAVLVSLICASLAALAVQAAPINDFTFKSPAFSGIGYSSHVLTIENQESTRRKTLQDKIQGALDKQAADKKNTNLAKFLNNLESRIYAQISQNVATAMFANSGCTATSTECKGEVDFQGNQIKWEKVADLINGDMIQLTVIGPDVNTTIQIPLSQFVIPGK
jgi:hypothetical protein